MTMRNAEKRLPCPHRHPRRAVEVQVEVHRPGPGHPTCGRHNLIVGLATTEWCKR